MLKDPCKVMESLEMDSKELAAEFPEQFRFCDESGWHFDIQGVTCGECDAPVMMLEACRRCRQPLCIDCMKAHVFSACVLDDTCVR